MTRFEVIGSNNFHFQYAMLTSEAPYFGARLVHFEMNIDQLYALLDRDCDLWFLKPAEAMSKLQEMRALGSHLSANDKKNFDLYLHACEAICLMRLGNNDEAYKATAEVIDSCEEGSERAFALAICVSALISVGTTDYKARYQDLKNTLEHCKTKFKSDFLESFASLLLGTLQVRNQEFRKACMSLQNAVALAPQGSHISATAHSTLGGALGALGDYEGSGQVYGEALKVHKAQENKAGMAWSLHNIACTLSNSRQFKEALTASLECHEILDSVDDKNSTTIARLSGFAWLLRGNLELKTGKRDSSCKSIEEGLIWGERTSNKNVIAMGLFRLGEYRTAIGKPEEAIKFFLKGFDANPGSVRNFEGHIGLALAKSKLEKHEEAVTEINRALDLAAQCEHIGVKMEALHSAVPVYEAAGFLKQALTYQRLAHSYEKHNLKNSLKSQMDLLRFKMKLEKSAHREKLLKDSQNSLKAQVADQTAELRKNNNKLLDQFTEMKRVEKERDAVAEQLLQSQKMEAAGRIAAGVAHDINNALTVISGYCELLYGGNANQKSSTQAIKAIRDASDKAADMTSQLLAFCRQQPRIVQVVDASEILQELKLMMSRLLPESMQLQLKLCDPTYYIKVDKIQLEQVLLNLVLNARDAIPANGLITVSLSASESKKDSISIAVQDNGSGIKPELLDKVFDPFFSTKGLGQGTGLGLSTAYGIVQQHHGSISIQSELHIGTRVTVELPTTQEKPAGAETPRKLDSSRSADNLEAADKLRILLVEDDKAVREIVVDSLLSYGHQVTQAEHGKIALDILKQENANFDVVISDIVMPVMGGQELLQHARPQWPDLKFVFTSGYPPGFDEIPRASTFVAKPFRAKDLDAAFESLGIKTQEVALRNIPSLTAKTKKT